MKVHYLQHVPFEGIGSMQNWVDANGHELTVTRFWAGDTLPILDDFDFLIVMGGPMNIYEDDQHPWLPDERDFIRAAIDSGKRILGVCLGAQLIADALGSKVIPGKQREIGWFAVNKVANDSALDGVFPESFTAFHWHGDTFAIPDCAIHLASTPACASQAFVYDNRVLGLQFHLETTLESATAMVRNCGTELVDAPYIQSANEILDPKQPFSEVNQLMQAVLQRLLS